LTVGAGPAFGGAALAGDDHTPCTNPKLAPTAPTASAATIDFTDLRTSLLPSISSSHRNWLLDE
jgi:hypothetical protein